MLLLTRKLDKSVVIGDDIKVIPANANKEIQEIKKGGIKS